MMGTKPRWASGLRPHRVAPVARSSRDSPLPSEGRLGDVYALLDILIPPVGSLPERKGIVIRVGALRRRKKRGDLGGNGRTELRSRMPLFLREEAPSVRDDQTEITIPRLIQARVVHLVDDPVAHREPDQAASTESRTGPGLRARSRLEAQHLRFPDVRAPAP